MRRRSPSRSFRVAVAACLVAATTCQAEDAACRDGGCEPHCPTRPGQFGYYPTQWRRWPGAGPQPAAARDATTPAAPAPSVVPGPDEESPITPLPPIPGAAASAIRAHRAPVLPESPGVGERIEKLAEAADAARAADEATRRRFTDQLVAVLLSEHDPRVRCAILTIASGFDTPAATAICNGALEDPDPGVRLSACRVCAERRGADVVDRLVRRAREDADLGVRLRAVRALGEIGGPAVVPHLVALLDDPDPAVRSRTTAALARATGRDLGPDVERWRTWAANPAAAPPRWSLDAAMRRLF